MESTANVRREGRRIEELGAYLPRRSPCGEGIPPFVCALNAAQSAGYVMHIELAEAADDFATLARLTGWSVDEALCAARQTIELIEPSFVSRTADGDADQWQAYLLLGDALLQRVVTTFVVGTSRSEPVI